MSDCAAKGFCPLAYLGSRPCERSFTSNVGLKPGDLMELSAGLAGLEASCCWLSNVAIFASWIGVQSFMATVCAWEPGCPPKPAPPKVVFDANGWCERLFLEKLSPELPVLRRRPILSANHCIRVLNSKLEAMSVCYCAKQIASPASISLITTPISFAMRISSCLVGGMNSTGILDREYFNIDF